MLTRSVPKAAPDTALTSLEVQILDRLVPHRRQDRGGEDTLASYLTKIAKLGGYLARKKNPPPDNAIMRRGLSRLTAIKLAVTPGTELGGHCKTHRMVTLEA
jgi:hypothetical protein